MRMQSLVIGHSLGPCFPSRFRCNKGKHVFPLLEPRFKTFPAETFIGLLSPLRSSELGEPEDFSPDRQQEIEVQAALDRSIISPRMRREKMPRQAKENAEANVVELDEARKHLRVVAYKGRIVAIEDSVNGNDQSRNEGEEINPACFPRE